MNRYKDMLDDNPTREEVNTYFRVYHNNLLNMIDIALKDAGFDNGIADISEEEVGEMIKLIDCKITLDLAERAKMLSRHCENLLSQKRDKEWESFVDDLFSELRVR